MRLNEIKHQSYAGEKNSQFGTAWVHRGEESKKVKTADVEHHLADGWSRGRKRPYTPEEIKQRNADGKQKQRRYHHICESCGVSFVGMKNQITCSKACAKKIAGVKAASTMKERGTFSGWHYRKGETSYPERYLEDVFSQEQITGWTREKKVGRWFIDFAFEQRKIAVEMDGRQHDDRADQDKKKDEFLTSQGWQVIRIKWFNPRTEQGKQKLHPQIQSLLDTLRVA